jgi:hypothetical protein
MRQRPWSNSRRFRIEFRSGLKVLYNTGILAEPGTNEYRGSARCNKRNRVVTPARMCEHVWLERMGTIPLRLLLQSSSPDRLSSVPLPSEFLRNFRIGTRRCSLFDYL